MKNVNIVAEEIISYFNSKSAPISNLVLQKFLYFLQKEYFIENKSLLFDENFLAFKYGPVIESVWKTYKNYGNNNLFASIEVEQPKYLKFLDKYMYVPAWELVEQCKEDYTYQQVTKKFDNLESIDYQELELLWKKRRLNN